MPRRRSLDLCVGATGKEMAGLPGGRGEHPIPGGDELEVHLCRILGEVVWVIAAGGEDWD